MHIRKIINRRNCAEHIYYDDVPTMIKEIQPLEKQTNRFE